MARETYAERIARGTAKYLSAHPDASPDEAKRFARGHGSTGEHGVTVTQVGQDVVVTFRDPSKLQQAMRAAEKYGERADVTIVGKNGKAVEAFQNKGHLAGRSLDSIKALAGKDGLYEAVASGAGGDKYDLAEAIGGAGNVAEYQVIVH